MIKSLQVLDSTLENFSYNHIENEISLITYCLGLSISIKEIILMNHLFLGYLCILFHHLPNG